MDIKKIAMEESASKGKRYVDKIRIVREEFLLNKDKEFEKLVRENCDNLLSTEGSMRINIALFIKSCTSIDLEFDVLELDEVYKEVETYLINALEEYDTYVHRGTVLITSKDMSDKLRQRKIIDLKYTVGWKKPSDKEVKMDHIIGTTIWTVFCTILLIYTFYTRIFVNL